MAKPGGTNGLRALLPSEELIATVVVCHASMVVVMLKVATFSLGIY